MGVKIGYHFASTLMGNLLIRSLPVIGPIITLPTKEHLTTPNLLLGLPDSITKHNTVLIVYTRLFSFIIKVMLFNRLLYNSHLFSFIIKVMLFNRLLYNSHTIEMTRQ
jgi:hypothetical protein